MRRVAHFIDSEDAGGAETLVVEMCRNLKSHGYESEIWHFGNSWLMEKCELHEIPIVLVPGLRFYKSKNTLLFFNIIFGKFILSRRIDILHSHLFGTITGSCLSAYFTRTPHVGTIHDTYTLMEKETRVLLLRGAMALGTRLVAVSRQMKDYLEISGRFPPGTIRIIFNGVNIEKFSSADGSGLRKELGLTAEEIVLIAVGRLVDIKGFDVLIESIHHINIPKRSVRLLIVGDGPEKEKYRKMILERGLEGRITLMGQRDDVPELLRISDCFVLASRSEGLSCSIIEAMASGLPVVATRVGGNAELVSDGVSGYLVPPDDPISLARKLSELIIDDERRRELGKKSLENAASNYSRDKMIERYAHIYDLFFKESHWE